MNIIDFFLSDFALYRKLRGGKWFCIKTEVCFMKETRYILADTQGDASEIALKDMLKKHLKKW